MENLTTLYCGVTPIILISTKMTNLFDEISCQRRLYYAHIISVVSLLSCMCLSHNLWIDISRTIPRVPLINFTATNPVTEYALVTGAIIFLALSIVGKKSVFYTVCSIMIFVLLIVEDQIRLQPWIYLYLIIILISSLHSVEKGGREAKANRLFAIQLALAFLYFWSGVQKMNWTFCNDVMPRLLKPFLGSIQLPPSIGLLIAFGEMMIGIALLINIVRKFAVFAAIIFHVLILMMLILQKLDSVIWPWNLSMIILIPLIFSNNDVGFKIYLRQFTFWLCGVLPVLSFIGLWDRFLSAALYSGGSPYGVIRLKEKDSHKLPASVQRHVTSLQNGDFLILFNWAKDELNVPLYPEVRYYKKMAQQLCLLNDSTHNIELVLKERPEIFTGKSIIRQFSCHDLNKK